MDPEFAALAAEALRLRQRREPPLVVLTRDASFGPPTAALDTACRTADALGRARSAWSSAVSATEDATAEQLRSVADFLSTAAGVDSRLGQTLGAAR